MANHNPQRGFISLRWWLLIINLVIGILGFSYLQWAEGQSQVIIWVPNRDLPSYRQIQATDLVERVVPGRNISPEIVKEINQIRDRYTVAEVEEGKPIMRRQLGPELSVDQKNLLQNSVLIGIPATPAMILGGNLRAGDWVDITLVQEATEKQSNPKSILFANTFVFDIKPNPANTSAASQSPEWVVVLAIPANRQEEFTRSVLGRKVTLSRKL